MHSLLRNVTVWLAIAALGAASLTASPVSDLEKPIHEPDLDFSHAVGLHDLDIELGGGLFEVEEGVLVPTNPLAGRVVELVFLGKASFRLAPPDEIETHQLEVFTQQRSLQAEIDEAVLVVGSASTTGQLLHRPVAGLDATTQAHAQRVFDGWIHGAERHALGVDVAIWRAISTDRLYQGYFAAMFHAIDLNRFCLVLDPAEREQLMVGRFVPSELDDREKHDAERALRRSRKEGRGIFLRLEDLGTWDTWMRASLRDGDGKPIPGSTSFEPEHYDLEVRLDPKALSLKGRARLHLKAVREGSQAVALDLFEDLIPNAIHDGAGHDLAWFRSGSALHVMLVEPAHLNDPLTLEVDYGGTIFNGLGGDSFSLRDTGGWYPHAGTTDRATYKLTLRWPKKYDLMASGKSLERRQEGGELVETRLLDVPADQVSFEIGKFDIVETQAGHVKIAVAFNQATMGGSKAVQQQVLTTFSGALQFYEQKFGAYPLDYLSVVTVQRRFSQGFLGFVTLADDLLSLHTLFTPQMTTEDYASRQRMETVAHELAHQWWGNLMGWRSYRDQWLSEALAHYSAVLYLQSQSEHQGVYLAEHAKDWKHMLRQTTLDGRSLESLGPVTMGERLYSSVSARAYQAVIYGKGPLVFGMLGRAVGQDKLTLMLKNLVIALANRPIDTETFLAALERMGSLKLGSFSRQFVYGTGVPEVYYSYQFKKSDQGQWEVQGEARQVLTSHDVYRPFRKGEGWDITRIQGGLTPPSDWTLLIPFQVILEAGEGTSDTSKRSQYQTGRGLGGTLKVSGSSTPFNFKIDKKPADFWLDQNGEVLAYFFCSSREPKRALRYMAAQGPPEEGEATYKRALQAELLSGEALKDSDLSDRDLKRETRLEDARIYFGLSRWYLDHGRAEESERALRSGEELIRATEAKFWDAERAALQGRLKLLRGDYKEIYNRLSGELRMDFPVKAGEHAAAGWRRAHWSTGRLGDAEDYAMLAVAAFETSHREVAQLATKYAEDRGADMTALKQLMPGEK